MHEKSGKNNIEKHNQFPCNSKIILEKGNAYSNYLKKN